MPTESRTQPQPARIATQPVGPALNQVHTQPQPAQVATQPTSWAGSPTDIADLTTKEIAIYNFLKSLYAWARGNESCQEDVFTESNPLKDFKDG